MTFSRRACPPSRTPAKLLAPRWTQLAARLSSPKSSEPAKLYTRAPHVFRRSVSTGEGLGCWAGRGILRRMCRGLALDLLEAERLGLPTDDGLHGDDARGDHQGVFVAGLAGAAGVFVLGKM